MIDILQLNIDRWISTLDHNAPPSVLQINFISELRITALRILCLLTKKAMKASYWQYINNILTKSLEEGNVKPFWNYIKSKNKDSAGTAPLKLNGILHSEGKYSQKTIPIWFFQQTYLVCYQKPQISTIQK